MGEHYDAEVLRLFIALELPAPVIAELTAVQQQLRRCGKHPVKWVEPTNMHMTLQFLGDVATERVAAIVAALAALQTVDAQLYLSQVGVFPNTRRPQVLWVGVGGATRQLEQLQQRVVLATAPLGFVAETRPYRAHLTLGRVRRDATTTEQRNLVATLEQLPAPKAVGWCAGRPLLFRSILTREGPIYQVLNPGT